MTITSNISRVECAGCGETSHLPIPLPLFEDTDPLAHIIAPTVVSGNVTLPDLWADAKCKLAEVVKDPDTTIRIVDAVREATEEIVVMSGREWGGRDSYIVAGETLTTAMEQDVLHTTISLYRGADETTVVEEWYHHFWDHLTDGEREAFFPVYEAAATDLPINEWFAQQGTDFFFARNLDTLAGPKRTFQKVKDVFLRFIGRVWNRLGNKLPPALRQAYIEAVYDNSWLTEGRSRLGKAYQVKGKGRQPLIEVKGDEFGKGISEEQYKKKAKKWASDNLTKDPYLCDSSNIEVHANPVGIGESVQGNIKKAQLLIKLDEMIKRMRYLYSEPPKASKGKNIRAMHRFKVELTLAGKPEDIGLVIREDNNGYYHYDHYIIDPKKYIDPNDIKKGNQQGLYIREDLRSGENTNKPQKSGPDGMSRGVEIDKDLRTTPDAYGPTNKSIESKPGTVKIEQSPQDKPQKSGPDGISRGLEITEDLVASPDAYGPTERSIETEPGSVKGKEPNPQDQTRTAPDDKSLPLSAQTSKEAGSGQEDLPEGIRLTAGGEVVVAPEKEAQVVGQVFEGKTPAAEQGEPQELILTGGPPGAGKSTSLGLMKIDKSKAVDINSDNVKEALGMGDRSKMIHEESSRIAKKALDQAIEDGYHTVYDSVLKNFSLADRLIRKVLAEDGRVFIAFTHVDAEMSAFRSDLRYALGESQREVPRRASVEGYNQSLPTFIELFNKYKDDPRVSFSLVDNSQDISPEEWAAGKRPEPVFVHQNGQTNNINQEAFARLMGIDYNKAVTPEGMVRYERKDSATEEALQAKEEDIRGRVLRRVSEGPDRGVGQPGDPATADRGAASEGRGAEEGRAAEEGGELPEQELKDPTKSFQVRPTKAEVFKARQAKLQERLKDLLLIRSKPAYGGSEPPEREAGGPGGPDDLDHGFPRDLNLFHLRDVEDLKAALRLAAARVQRQNRPIGREEALKQADKLGMILPQLLAGKPTGVEPEAWIAASAGLMQSTAAKVKELAAKVLDPETASAEKIAFHQAWQIHDTARAEVQGPGGQQGRGLGVLNSIFKPSPAMVNNTDLIVQALESGNLRGRTSDLARLVLESESIHQLNKTLKAAAQGKTWEMILDSWKAGLQWTLTSQMAGSLTKATTVFWYRPWEATVSSITGRAGQALEARAKAMEEAEAISWYRGALEGFWDAVRLAGQRLSAGRGQDWGEISDFLKGPTNSRSGDAGRTAWNAFREAGLDPAEKIEADRVGAIPFQAPRGGGGLPAAIVDKAGAMGAAADMMGLGVDSAAKPLRGPFRLLGAEDAFLKDWGLAMAAGKMAYQRAVQEAVQRDLHGRRRSAYIGRRMTEILANSEEELPDLHQEAVDHTKIKAFQEKLGSGLESLQRFPAKTPSDRFILHFFKTLINPAKLDLQQATVTALAPAFYQDLKAGGIKRDLAVARFTLGGMYFGLAFYLASLGLISGQGPGDEGRRRSLEEVDGWRTWSFRSGPEGRWIGYNRRDPLGFTLGLGARAYEMFHYGQGVLEDADYTSIILAGMLGVYEYTGDRSFTAGYHRFISALHPSNPASQDPEGTLKHPLGRWFQGRASTKLPFSSLSRNGSRGMDPIMGQVETVFDELREGIPGLSGSQPSALDVWAQEKIRPGGWLYPEWMSPFHHGALQGDPVDKELARLVDSVGLIVPSIGPYVQKDKTTLKLSPEEHNRLIRIFVEDLEAKKMIQELINSEGYQKSSDELRALKVRERFAQLRLWAGQRYLTQTPELRQTMREEARTMRLEVYGGYGQ